VTVVQESFYDSETVTLSDAESYVVFSVDLNSTSGDSFEAPWAYLVSAGDVSVDSQFADYDAVVEPIEGEQLSGGFTDRATAYYVLRTGADISREDVKIRLEHTPGFSNEGPAADYRLE
jgi:hypothetical protein